MSNRSMTRAVVAVVAMLAVWAALALAVPVEKPAPYWCAFAFGCVAIVAQAAFAAYSFGRPGVRSKFYGFPVARVGAVYLVAQLVCSAVLMVVACLVPDVPAIVPVLVGVLLVALAALGTVAVDAARDYVESADAAQARDTSAMKALRARAASLEAACTDADTRAAVAELAEALRYADPVATDATAQCDLELVTLLGLAEDSLRAGDAALARATCAKARAKLAERAQVALAAGRG